MSSECTATVPPPASERSPGQLKTPQKLAGRGLAGGRGEKKRKHYLKGLWEAVGTNTFAYSRAGVLISPDDLCILLAVA